MHTFLKLGLAAAMGLGAALAGAPAQAQFYGAEDGYNDDGIGWGPAYRRDTTFRPAIGFYGGVERPYPYGAPETTNPVVRNGVVYGGGLPPRPAVTTTGSIRDPGVVYEDGPRVVSRRVVRSRPVSVYGPRVVTRRVVRARPFVSAAPRRGVRGRVVTAPGRSFDGRPRVVARNVIRY